MSRYDIICQLLTAIFKTLPYKAEIGLAILLALLSILFLR